MKNVSRKTILRVVCSLFLATWIWLPAHAVEPVREQYQKMEYKIPMRDGVLLYTAVYVPRDASPNKTYPFLLERTCFGVTPYGPDQYKTVIGPSPALQNEGYIFVYQDVRGRWASEGRWTSMTPVVSDQLKQSSSRY